MIAHYLKVGIRNLLKYKLQTFVSVIGLAVGFTCFAFSSLWIRYELTYDSFHPDAERIYVMEKYGRQDMTDAPVQYYLQENFVEVEEGASVIKVVYLNDAEQPVTVLRVGRDFFRMFPVLFQQGSEEFFFSSPDHAIVSDRAITRFHGGKSPVGESLLVNEKKALSVSSGFPKEEAERYDITAVVRSWDTGHSDLLFDYIVPDLRTDDWDCTWTTTFLKLRDGVDAQAFEHKLRTVNSRIQSDRLFLYPLSSMRLTENQCLAQAGNLTLKQLILVEIAGLVTVLCLIFNYVSLFVARLQQKSREMALRLVLGSSFSRLYLLLGVEVVLVMLLSCATGAFLIEWLMPGFLSFAGIQNDTSGFFPELSLYMLMLVVLSLLVVAWPLYRMRHAALAAVSRNGLSAGEGSVVSRHAMLWFQLTAGVLFLFCTSVFVCQIRYLNRTDLGFDRARLCFAETTNSSYDFSQEVGQMKSFPEIEDVCGYTQGRIGGPVGYYAFSSLRGNDEQGKAIPCYLRQVNAAYFRLCGIDCKQGRLFNDSVPEETIYDVVINEAAARFFGFENPVGQKILSDVNTTHTIIGVVNDIYEYASLEVNPLVYWYGSRNKEGGLLYRYKPGLKEAAEKRVRELMSKKASDDILVFSYMEELLDSQNRTEINFLKLLYLLSFVCIGGSMFGIYAMVSLSCERRRKEIAIRKINGASMATLLKLFLRQYLLLLSAASVVAFVIGYALMHNWLEQFVLRAPISLWLCPSLFAAVGVVLSVIVIARIWKSLHLNPSQELRKE